ncbi:hypothetical protein KAX22_03830 [bacterium]|nr:hypothetical protein [bacterium]
MDSVQHRKEALRAYGYVGLAVILLAEILMFLRVEPVYTFFTPIVWSGYILFVDSIICKIQGRSLISHRLGELLFMLFFSLAFWLIFELYNLHIKNWHYVGFPRQLWATCLGCGWAFATILPAILLTARLLELVGFPKVTVPRVRIGGGLRWTLIVLGALCLTVPLLLPFSMARHLIAPIWLGFIFLFDPINHMRGRWSLLGDLGRGDLSRILVLFASGLICGLLWEFWNYWAKARWIYAVPFAFGPRIFEMPLGGYLGFLPFAIECYVMCVFVMTLRQRSWFPGREV